MISQKYLLDTILNQKMVKNEALGTVVLSEKVYAKNKKHHCKINSYTFNSNTFFLYVIIYIDELIIIKLIMCFCCHIQNFVV